MTQEAVWRATKVLPCCAPTSDSLLERAGLPMSVRAGVASPRAFALIPYVTHRYDGIVVWAHLVTDESRLFLLLADAPIDPREQAVLFYLWTADVTALRDHLVASHIPVGAVTYPPYMPQGEIRLEDPDRYVLLIGQVRR